jgi:hypothetical protein
MKNEEIASAALNKIESNLFPKEEKEEFLLGLCHCLIYKSGEEKKELLISLEDNAMKMIRMELIKKEKEGGEK